MLPVASFATPSSVFAEPIARSADAFSGGKLPGRTAGSGPFPRTSLLIRSGWTLQARDQVRVLVLPRELERRLPFLRLHVRRRAGFEQHVDHRGAAEVDG